MHPQSKAGTATTVAMLLASVLGGCAAGEPTSPSPGQQGVEPGASVDPRSLECEEQAFPCSFAEVSQAVRDETLRLAGLARDRFTAGETNETIAAWLESETAVAEVEFDDDSIRFRPTDGRAVWIIRPTESSAPPPARRPGALAGLSAWDGGAWSGSTGQTVTGAGQSQRQALVLSPYKWDFGYSDDGEAVALRLRELPDYGAGVTYVENATAESTDVSVDDFRGWQDMQVVHLVTHGARLCKAGKCRAVIAAHALPGAQADVLHSEVRGLDLEVDVSLPARAFPVLLGADFFRAEYPTGLGDTVVFLNGCSTFGPGATDLVDAIRGSGSVVLGWSDSVASTAAQSASLALYEGLAGGGRTVGAALVGIGGLTNDSTNGAVLASSGRAIGGDLRIREVVDFQDAAANGSLANGASVRLVGSPGDGVPDSVSWQLRVDGIEPQSATALVSVTIDGHPGAPAAVSTGTKSGVDWWLMSGTLNMGVDVDVPHPALFEVTLALPEGGLSVDTVAATLVGEVEPSPIVPSLGTTWRGHATQRREQPFEGVFTVADADLTFTVNVRNPDLPVFAYELTGGTMTYSVSGTRSDGCTYELAPTEITITPEVAEDAGEFVIDARDSPPTFYGFVNVVGPVVEVMQTCPDPYGYLTGPYSTGANATLIDVSTSAPGTAVGDRISGTSSDGTTTFDIARVE